MQWQHPEEHWDSTGSQFHLFCLWESQEGICVVLHPPAPLDPFHPSILSCFCGLIGREQTSWPEHLPEEPAEPAAAGVQGQGGAAHPLPPGLDLLRHLHLQHL